MKSNTITSLRKFKLRYSIAVLTLVLGFGAIASWVWWRGAIAPAVRELESETEGVRFTVERGMSGQQIGEKLVEANLIKSPTAWKLWTWQQQKRDPSGGFKAGTYLLSPQASLPAIAGKIWRGEIMQTTFTIPEGRSIEEMGKYFERLGYFSAAEFVAATREIPYERYPWLPPNLPHLEGFLYPDTYKISSDRATNPQAIIRVMLDRFQQVALPVYQQAKTDFALLEWVTLGSIVEKEAVVAEERALIAGVFVARLEKGMKLEADPTVEYGLGIRQTVDKPLTYAQVGTPSPYNTYLNFGLPPTPIASPGIASLKAVLNPQSSEYLYFVARYDGTHVFSKTLVEHEAATKEIRRQRQQR